MLLLISSFFFFFNNNIYLFMSISDLQTAKPASLTVIIETGKCFSCGFTEDCTPAYILRIRERYQGRWLCGLCIEAVKDEFLRSEKLISVEEALERHINFCHKFRESNFHEEQETEHPMGRILRPSMVSPRILRFSSNAGSLPETGDDVPPPPPVRSGSCFSSLSS